MSKRAAGFCRKCPTSAWPVERGANPPRVVAWRWTGPHGERLEPLPLEQHGPAPAAPEACPACRSGRPCADCLVLAAAPGDVVCPGCRSGRERRP